MPMTMTAAQKEFVEDKARMRVLAEWVLSNTEVHSLEGIRKAARMSYSAQPVNNEIEAMYAYLRGADDSTLIRLINGYNNTQAGPQQ